MHKNYRRKNPRNPRRWPRPWYGSGKKYWLNQRTRKRRRRDKRLLHRGLREDPIYWDQIRRFENPVDWWLID